MTSILSHRGSATLIRRRANQFLVATILALYGAITVGGPALHALPGFGHGPRRLGSDETLSGWSDQKDAAAHDCPICHFHAQGQVVADPDTCPCIDGVRIRPASEPPLAPPPAVDRPSIPPHSPLV